MNRAAPSRHTTHRPWHRLNLAVLLLVSIGVDAGCSAQTTPDTTATQRPAGTAAPAGRLSGDDQSRLAQVARIVTPAVVSIDAEFSAQVAAQMEGQPQLPPGIPPGLLPPGLEPAPRGPARATGSGFIVTPDGYILTNNHVVANAERVTVTLMDRRIFPATVVGRDPNTDVALIKIRGDRFPTVQLGADSTVEVGEPVLAFGNPLGLDFTVTSGIISAKGRSGSLRGLFPTDYAIVDFLQTDAAISPGNSGGPLVDMQARVIGINSAIASPTGVSAGYGFAIPVSIGRIVMDEIRKYGKVRHAILGVTIQDVRPADARVAGLETIRGALVGGYAGSDSPARRAGLEPGDVILAVNGQPVDQVAELQRILLGFQPGERVTVDVMRYGSKRTVQVTLGEAPEPPVTQAAGEVARGEESASGRLGIAAVPVTPDIAARLELPSGTTGVAVARVDPSGPAAGLLAPEDVIVATLGPDGRRPVHSVEDLRQAITAARNDVVSLLVYSPQLEGTRVVNVALGAMR